MIMTQTAYRGISVPSLRNLSITGENAAEYELAANEDLLDSIPVNSPNEGCASPAQARLMIDLISQLRELDTELAGKAQRYTDGMAGKWTLGRDGNASRWITNMINKIAEVRQSQKNQQAQAQAIEDGMYVLDGQIFKVQHAVHGSGKQYAKRLVAQGVGEKSVFIYAPGAVNQLRPEHKMTIEQAKEWGALYGTCVRCGALLTAEDSIERMMGPTCAGKI